MTIKQFIKHLSKLPQDHIINYGMTHLQTKDNTKEHDFNLHDLFKFDEIPQITMWCEE